MTPSASLPLPLPLVARSTQLAVLHTALDQAAGGHGSTVLITGEGGGGKSRLVRAVADDAARRGWTVAVGRAYPVETGVPYALFSDALLPLLRSLEPAKLAVLARGGEAELGYLFPALALAGERDRPHRGDPAEFKARLLWNLTEFLGRFSAQQPLLIALEALEWADASSLELLHFVARQIGGHRILLLCTYNEAERERNPALRSAEQSLVSLGLARVLELGPLTRAETGELVQRAFGVEGSVCREFSALLHEWTRGNVFFIEETLKALVDAGRLRNEQGVWLGWELENLTLPRSIRDALMARFDRLSAPARALAELAAVTAGRDTYDALRSLTGLPEPELLAALEELRLQHILREAAEGGTIVYDFAHPLLRETLYGALGMARTRALHASVAEALEALYGDEVMDHADQLAFHYARADARNLAPKALKYLVAAGRRALARHANREAANYLSAALEHVERGTELDAELAGTLAADLARARQRLGEYAAAIALWERARSEAERTGDPRRLAAIERRLGLAYYWSGHHPEALRHYDAGLAAARAAADDEVRVKLQLARGNCLQELGRPEEAKQEIQAALSLAERLGDRSLLARAHRALLMLHIWTGPPERAREHGARAVALAHECGRRAVECSVHWGLAVLEGLTGDAQASARHLRESERIAEELRSPLLR
ncbi:MAG: AAA family ATPase, partial [Gemmatimonadetes bacterium]|nr:AAA family ATPase [Gemmatimonadota bacterium]